MRWPLYLIAALFAEGIALATCGIWSAFAVDRFGWVNNASGHATEPRLPRWLAWLDTKDNSLLGDQNHRIRHANSSRYWQMTCWLARNRAYGFKWTVLGAPMTQGRIFEGDPLINHHTGRFGTLKITMGDYWQWKRVSRLWFGYVAILNFGWLLDDGNQPKALFMFSPRIKKYA